MKRFLLILFSIGVLICALFLYQRAIIPPNSSEVTPPVLHQTSPSAPTHTPTSPISCLRIISPQKNQLIISPLTVTVVVDNTSNTCHWTVFEAQAGTIEIVDDEGTTIGTSALKTTDNWMTNKAVTYEGIVIFTKAPASDNIVLQITEENPSGKPNPQTVTLPLKTGGHE